MSVKKLMSGRDFIRAIKPMLGIDTGIVSLTIKAGVGEPAKCEAVVFVGDANIDIEEYEPTEEKTKTRCFRFEVTEITEEG